jgi:hypothetical protein
MAGFAICSPKVSPEKMGKRPNKTIGSTLQIIPCLFSWLNKKVLMNPPIHYYSVKILLSFPVFKSSDECNNYSSTYRKQRSLSKRWMPYNLPHLYL